MLTVSSRGAFDSWFLSNDMCQHLWSLLTLEVRAVVVYSFESHSGGIQMSRIIPISKYLLGKDYISRNLVRRIIYNFSSLRRQNYYFLLVGRRDRSRFLLEENLD